MGELLADYQDVVDLLTTISVPDVASSDPSSPVTSVGSARRSRRSRPANRCANVDKQIGRRGSSPTNPADMPTPRKRRQESETLHTVFKKQRARSSVAAPAKQADMEGDEYVKSSDEELVLLFEVAETTGLPSGVSDSLDLLCHEPPLHKKVHFSGLPSDPPEFRAGTTRRVPLVWKACTHVRLLRCNFDFLKTRVDTEVRALPLSPCVRWSCV